MKWKKTIAAATASALVLGTCAGYGNAEEKKASASELFSTEEILAPVWEGNVSYQESVLAVEEEDGSLAPVSLLYPIEEIVSVKSASLLVAYEAEKDYSVRDGKLVIKKDGGDPRSYLFRISPGYGHFGIRGQKRRLRTVERRELVSFETDRRDLYSTRKAMRDTSPKGKGGFWKGRCKSWKGIR